MSRIDLLLDVVADMRTLADSLHSMANAIVGDDAATEKPTLAATVPAPKAVSLEQVRAVLAEKSYSGFTGQVHALIQKYGAQKLSAIDPGRYADLMRDAEELTDAGK